MISRWIRNLSMSYRLGLSFLAMLVGLLILVSIPIIWMTGQSLDQAYRTQLDTIALEKEANLSELFGHATQILNTIASYPDFANYLDGDGNVIPGSITEAQVNAGLSAWTGSDKQFLELAIVDPQSGTILVSSDASLDRQPFISASGDWLTSGSHLSPVLFENAPARPTMYILAQVQGLNRPAPAFLVGRLNMDLVAAVINRRTSGNQSDEALLVTRDRQLVLAPRLSAGQYAPGQTVDSQALRSCVAGSSGTSVAPDYRNVPAVIDYRWLPEAQLCLVVKLDQAEIYAPTQQVTRSITIVAVAGLLLAMLVAGMLTRQLARPLNDLVHGVEAFGHGELGLRFPASSQDEIGRLKTAFNQMADNLQESLKQLTESEMRYRRLAEGTFEGLVFSENGLILDTNPQFAWMFGCHPEELPGKSLLEFVAPESRELVAAHLQSSQNLTYAFTGLRQNNSTVAVEASSHLTTYQGRWVQLTAIRDISPQKQDQAAEARLLSIIEATPDYISTAAPDGQFLFLNRAARRMLGIGENADISNRNIREVHPEWANRIVLEEGIPAAIQNGTWVGENAILAGDGREIPVSKVIIAHHTPAGELEYISTINRDISDQKRLENELRAARDELEQRVKERTAEVAIKAQELARSNAELEQFAYVASHDLQEPLRMISSYLQLLERRYKGQLDANADEYINYAVDGARRLKVLINDLLAYSRVGTHTRPFETVDSGEVVAQVCQTLQLAIQETHATVHYGRLPTLQADPVQLGQLFQNLIANALKFKGEETPHIEIRAERRAREWVFSVQDNGIGIEPQYVERIFIIFQRLHSRESYPGTGIGLAVCKRIVERHGGRIWVESEPGQGATFFFSLPDH